jgi:hypothetical protein
MFRGLPLLLIITFTASAANIRFDPPDPNSRTAVTAYVTGAVNSCDPQGSTVTKNGSTISIAIDVPCSIPFPVIKGWTIPVDLGLIPPGVYSVTAAVPGITLGSATLVVRDASPAFDVVPNVTSAAGDQVRLIGKNLVSCAQSCAAPTVKFGDAVAPIDSVSAGEIDVRAPVHAAGPVDVTVESDNSVLRSPGAFYYVPSLVQQLDPAFYEPVLIPVIYSGPGAYGSQWDTEVVLRNENDYQLTLPEGSIFSVSCGIILPCAGRPLPHRAMKLTGIQYPTGYIQFVPRQAAASLHFDVLFRDLSRQAEAFGTEIPVIREKETFDRPFELLNVPTDSRFRVGLRLYAFGAAAFPHITISSLDSDLALVSTDMQLYAEASGVSVGTTPAYAQISDLVVAYPQLVGKGPLRIVIDRGAWAFVTVTNNETQQVTTISPQ